MIWSWHGGASAVLGIPAQVAHCLGLVRQSGALKQAKGFLVRACYALLWNNRELLDDVCLTHFLS